MPSAGSRSRPGPFVQFVRWLFGVGAERNVGGLERTVRYLGGALCLVLAAVAAFSRPVTVTTLLVAAVLFGGGLFLVYEAQVQYCPVNASLGRSSLRE